LFTNRWPPGCVHPSVIQRGFSFWLHMPIMGVWVQCFHYHCGSFRAHFLPSGGSMFCLAVPSHCCESNRSVVGQLPFHCLRVISVQPFALAMMLSESLWVEPCTLGQPNLSNEGCILSCVRGFSFASLLCYSWAALGVEPKSGCCHKCAGTIPAYLAQLSRF